MFLACYMFGISSSNPSWPYSRMTIHQAQLV